MLILAHVVERTAALTQISDVRARVAVIHDDPPKEPMAEDADDALDAGLDADELMRMVQQLNDNLTGSFDEMFKVYPLVVRRESYRAHTLPLQGLESTLAALDGSLGGMESNFDGAPHATRTVRDA